MRAQLSVGDDIDAIAGALREALDKSDGAIVTGGLGTNLGRSDQRRRCKSPRQRFITTSISNHFSKRDMRGWDSCPTSFFRQAYLPEVRSR